MNPYHQFVSIIATNYEDSVPPQTVYFDKTKYLSVGWVFESQFVILDSMDGIRDRSFENNSRIRIYSDGRLKYIKGMRWDTFCQIDLTFFPFDTQVM